MEETDNTTLWHIHRARRIKAQEKYAETGDLAFLTEAKNEQVLMNAHYEEIKFNR